MEGGYGGKEREETCIQRRKMKSRHLYGYWIIRIPLSYQWELQRVAQFLSFVCGIYLSPGQEEAQLPQRDRATRYASKFVLCLKVIKVSNRRGDLHGHSRTLAMVPFNRSHTISYLSSTATMSLFCTVSEIQLLIFQNLKRTRDSEHILFGSNISCMHWCFSVSIIHYTTFEVPSFTNYKDMIGAKLKKRAT